MSAVQTSFLPGPWLSVRDGNYSVRAIFDRHYSRHFYRDGRRPKLFAGPGEKEVLISPSGLAIFVWRKFRSMRAGEFGVNCAVFRNEGAGLSSDLICSAVAIAWRRWPGERLYTYVNPRCIRSTNPGYCFLMAGWRRCGTTPKGLIVLEMLP